MKEQTLNFIAEVILILCGIFIASAGIWLAYQEFVSMDNKLFH